LLSFFFFQAEDGIRDFHVTGVQTCALPILGKSRSSQSHGESAGHQGGAAKKRHFSQNGNSLLQQPVGGRRFARLLPTTGQPVPRSEERRVGKESRCGGWQAAKANSRRNR